MRLVVDASVAVKWFVREDAAQVDAARGLILQGYEMIAPGLLVSEVQNVMWKKHRLGQVTREQGEIVASTISSFFRHIETDGNLIKSAWEIAVEHDHPIYDCLYIVLAQKTDALLATFDRRLASLAKKAGVKLEKTTKKATG